MTPNATLMAALLKTAEDALKDCSPWADVRKITMSPARCEQLKSAAQNATSPVCVPWAAVEIEVYPACTDGFAVLIDGSGEILGLYSFTTGEARWFDPELMKRFSGPGAPR